MRIYLWLAILLGAVGCQSDPKKAARFELLSAEDTGLDFANMLEHTNEFNVYKYRNFYNGGGVALGDINGDGLIDVYMTSNQGSNKLYLNEGNFKFRDITDQAGVGGQKAWSTGVSMVDINGDKLLDIYVCNSGDVSGDDKENELFINNGDLTFTESAAEYNLNDHGYSTHASFFDYDKDGDLDVYILNNSYQAIGSFNLRKNERPNRDSLGGDKLMQNQNGRFVDVSEEAGIYGSVIGFGLGVTVGDVNNDNWEDIFVSNDFFERDYLYINQKDGTFKEELTSQMQSISGASMGADMADIDNDGKADIFVTEMLPSDYERLKTVTTFEDWNKYQYNVKNGYHHQFTRNVLHYNLGDDTFSEIGRLAGVEASDWSWGALFFDMDNDGLKDLFIANGIYKDLTNQDYLAYVANEEVVRSVIQKSGVNYDHLIDTIPSNMVANHSYINKDNLRFEVYDDSGLNMPSFSNGAAYGDLDNDGDLDLIVNNVNMPCFVYRNTSDTSTERYLKIELQGDGANTYAYGTKIEVSTGKHTYYYEVQPARGFQSSMDPRPNIGVDTAHTVDVKIIWPDLRISEFKDIASNQILQVKQAEGTTNEPMPKEQLVTFEKSKVHVPFMHLENSFVDFNQERLLYHMHSNLGPRVAVGDLNNDSYMDMIIPGAKGSASSIIWGSKDGLKGSESTVTELDQWKESEHVQAITFDANGDGHLDIYLASGGVELTKYSDYYYDVLLFNDGRGNFTQSTQKLPTEDRISTGVVSAGDVDGDGDIDLFVGERIKVGQYGAPCSGYILINDGHGAYEEATQRIAPELVDLGMISDATWTDIDLDGDLDLIVVGEFLGIEIFENVGGQLNRKENSPLSNVKGWWNVLHMVDIDQDGDEDLVVGNHGLNSRFKASELRPIRLYYDDFDKNGFEESIMAFTRDDNKEYPYALRHNLLDQLKGLKRNFPNFESFKTASMEDIFSREVLQSARVLEANHLETTVWINEGNFEFVQHRLPIEAQISPVYAVAARDFDMDGDIDILLGGNLHKVQPEVGIYDASYGVYLENQGGLDFRFVPDGRGLRLPGEIRDIQVLGDKVLMVRNNDSIVSFKFKK